MKHLAKLTAALLLSGAPQAYAATNWTANVPLICSGSSCKIDTSGSPPATDYMMQLPFSCAAALCTPGAWLVQLPGVPPAFTQQPQAQTVNVGQAATFTDAVSGNPTPTCQWQKSTNGGSTWSNASGASTNCASYTTPTTGTDNGTLYQNDATNNSGTVKSVAAILNVVQSCASATPGSGSVTDASSNVWTIDGSGNIKENGTLVNDGAGTAQITYIAGNTDGISGGNSVYAKDAGGTGWYEWVPANNDWTTVGANPPACGAQGTFTLGPYVFNNTAPFTDSFSSIDIGGAAQTTASPSYHFYANGATYGATGICCALYEGPDSSLYNPYSLSGGALKITMHNTASGWRSGAFQSIAPDGTGFTQKFGYWEITAKLPTGTDASFPSFWMLSVPAVKSQTLETDIFEQYGTCGPFPQGQAITSSIWGHNFPPPTTDPVALSQDIQLGYDMSAGFHTYGLLWDANNMSIYVDRVLKATVPTPSYDQQPAYAIVDLDYYPTSQSGCGGPPTTDASMYITNISVWPLPQ